jgi:hypothetical protein
MLTIERKPLFSLFVLVFLSSCGSDVDPGKIEGLPRSSEAIQQQDLKFFQTKESLLGRRSREYISNSIW